MFRSLFSRPSRTRKCANRTHSAGSLAYDGLEQKNLLAGFVTYVNDGTLLIVGAEAVDTVLVDYDGNFVKATLNGVDHSGYLASSILRIRFIALDGDDYFHNQTSIPSFAWGGNGNDNLIGGSARDEFYGGAGNDTLTGNAGFDHLAGGLGNDVLNGNAGDDFLNGNAGDDEIWAGPQNDRLVGGDGDDKLFGEDGEDLLLGGKGKDFLKGGNDRDRIFSGEGRFNESVLDAVDFWDDSELVRGTGIQISRLKANFERLTGNQVQVKRGDGFLFNINFDNDTLIRLQNTPILASELRRNHFLEINFNYDTRLATSITAFPMLINEGLTETTNGNRNSAVVFSPGALHDGGVNGRSTSSTDVDWYTFRSNVSGPIRLRVINPTSSQWPGANIEIQRADGTVIANTDYFINNFMDLNLNKGERYWIKASGVADPIVLRDYQILFEPMFF